MPPSRVPYRRDKQLRFRRGSRSTAIRSTAVGVHSVCRRRKPAPP